MMRSRSRPKGAKSAPHKPMRVNIFWLLFHFVSFHFILAGAGMRSGSTSVRLFDFALGGQGVPSSAPARRRVLVCAASQVFPLGASYLFPCIGPPRACHQMRPATRGRRRLREAWAGRGGRRAPIGARRSPDETFICTLLGAPGWLSSFGPDTTRRPAGQHKGGRQLAPTPRESINNLHNDLIGPAWRRAFFGAPRRPAAPQGSHSCLARTLGLVRALSRRPASATRARHSKALGATCQSSHGARPPRAATGISSGPIGRAPGGPMELNVVAKFD